MGLCSARSHSLPVGLWAVGVVCLDVPMNAAVELALSLYEPDMPPIDTTAELAQVIDLAVKNGLMQPDDAS